MKNILVKIKNNLLIYSIAFIIFNIVINFILYLFGLRFRFWILFLIVLISGISLFLGIFKTIKKLVQNKSIFKIINVFSVAVIFLIIFPTLNVLLWLNFGSEKLRVLDNKKYISLNGASLKKRDLFYYDYINPIVVGTKIKVHGDFGLKTHYNGEATFNYYDIYGNRFQEAKAKYQITDKDIIKLKDFLFVDKDNNYNYEDLEYDYLFPEDYEVLYEKRFDNIVIRYSIVGYALGQKKLISVIKSKDGGENYYSVTNGFIEGSDSSKFVFLNENFGFATRTDNIALEPHSVEDLYVTNDGGKTFQEAQLIYSPESIFVSSVRVEEMPYYDSEELIMKCSIYDVNEDETGYIRKYMLFKSNDNGITWTVKQK